MSDDLVRRARHFAQGCRGSMWQSRDTTIELMDKLTARIEALTAERDALRDAATEAAKQLRIIAGMDLMCASSTAYNAARDIEAALARKPPMTDKTR